MHLKIVDGRLVPVNSKFTTIAEALRHQRQEPGHHDGDAVLIRDAGDTCETLYVSTLGILTSNLTGITICPVDHKDKTMFVAVHENHKNWCMLERGKMVRMPGMNFRLLLFTNCR